MAEEEVAAAEASPAPLDHKRKLEDLEPEAPHQADLTSDEPEKSNGEHDATPAAADEAGAKRPRLDEKPDGSASENGHQEEKVDEPVKDNDDQPVLESTCSEEAQPQSDESAEKLTDERPPVDSQQQSVQESDDAQEPSNVETQPHSSEGHQQEDVPSVHKDRPTSDNETITRIVEVPNNKVGVLIGKAGDTIRYLQYNSGAKIQITRDAEADPHAPTRPVEIIGTLDSINKAEKLINAVIAEADAGGSPSLVARGLATSQAAAATEQIEIQVPNEKVGLIIGRGGETIKGLQARSGARIQLIPQHLPEGDESKERTVRVTGDKRQIDIAREMIKEVMSQTVRQSSFSGGYNQQGYRPRGHSGPPQWGPRGGHAAHSNSYGYHQRGPYPSHSPQYPQYGGYQQQMGPRSGFSSGWEQRPPPSMHGMPQHGGGYDYYGGQKGHYSDTPGSAQHSGPVPSHAPGPNPNPTMGPPQSQANYNYGQHQGPDYGHPAPYSQSAHPQQSYSHGYDDHASTQHHYGSSQPYPHSIAPTGYGQQQQSQYGKPSYGMPSQGPPPQSYGPPRPSQQPGDVPYQGSAPAQSYGQSVPSQQPYPYASSGPTQQAYPPYGSAPAAEGYNQPPPATGSGYPQQGGQPVASYGQSGLQQAAGYQQVVPTAAYGQYPSSQQGYAEQSAPTTASYGYQAPQDPSYGAAPASAYGAPPTAQAGYAAQPTQAQQSYDQSAQQTGAYGVQPSTSVAYGKTQSPQPGYAQYDSAQIYAAPH